VKNQKWSINRLHPGRDVFRAIRHLTRRSKDFMRLNQNGKRGVSFSSQRGLGLPGRIKNVAESPANRDHRLERVIERDRKGFTSRRHMPRVKLPGKDFLKKKREKKTRLTRVPETKIGKLALTVVCQEKLGWEGQERKAQKRKPLNG